MSRVRAHWYDAFDPVDVKVHCGEAIHLITWRRGRLLLHDHHLTAERSLVALGGAAPTCMDVLDAWASHRLPLNQLLDKLAFAYRVRKGDLQVPPMPARLHAAVARLAGHDLRQLQDFARLRTFSRFPATLLSRFALGRIAGLERRWPEAPEPARLDVELYALRVIRQAVIDSIGTWHRAYRSLHVDVDSRLGPLFTPAELAGRIDQGWARITATLPLSWLVTVWARGLAVVDGCLVLDAGEGDRADGTAVRWERVRGFEIEPVTVPVRLFRAAGGEWTLRWV